MVRVAAGARVGVGVRVRVRRALEVTEQHTGDRYVTHLIRVRFRIRARIRVGG